MDSHTRSSQILKALGNDPDQPGYTGGNNYGRFKQTPDNFLGEMLLPYLDMRSVAMTTSTCREFRSADHSPLPQRMVFNFDDVVDKYEPNPDTEYVYRDLGRVPFTLDAIEIRCKDFYDQGWGNRKGLIIIDLIREVVGDDGRTTSKTYRTTWPYTRAPHERNNPLCGNRRLRMSMEHLMCNGRFPRQVVKGDRIKVSYMIGGGGGHRLTILGLKLDFISKPPERGSLETNAPNRAEGFVIYDTLLETSVKGRSRFLSYADDEDQKVLQPLLSYRGVAFYGTSKLHQDNSKIVVNVHTPTEISLLNVWLFRWTSNHEIFLGVDVENCSFKPSVLPTRFEVIEANPLDAQGASQQVLNRWVYLRVKGTDLCLCRTSVQAGQQTVFIPSVAKAKDINDRELMTFRLVLYDDMKAATKAASDDD